MLSRWVSACFFLWFQHKVSPECLLAELCSIYSECFRGINGGCLRAATVIIVSCKHNLGPFGHRIHCTTLWLCFVRAEAAPAVPPEPDDPVSDHGLGLVRPRRSQPDDAGAEHQPGGCWDVPHPQRAHHDGKTFRVVGQSWLSSGCWFTASQFVLRYSRPVSNSKGCTSCGSANSYGLAVWAGGEELPVTLRVPSWQPLPPHPAGLRASHLQESVQPPGSPQVQQRGVGRWHVPHPVCSRYLNHSGLRWLTNRGHLGPQNDD